MRTTRNPHRTLGLTSRNFEAIHALAKSFERRAINRLRLLTGQETRNFARVEPYGEQVLRCLRQESVPLASSSQLGNPVDSLEPFHTPAERGFDPLSRS